MKGLSIIFGTYNRLALLKQCVESVRRSLGEETAYNIVITDGGSTDGTLGWLSEQLDCDVVVEEERRGAVAAFNDAYRRSSGDYVMVLNDDVEVLGDALDRGVRMLDEHPEYGQLAFAFSNETLTGGEFKCFPMHRHTYANLGMIRRTVADKVVEMCGGLWNPIYHTYGGDTELSCWVWRLGWEVRECNELRCIDHLAQDPLRAANNSGRNQLDGRRCHQRWYDHLCIEPMGPAPRLESHELEKLRAWENEKRACHECQGGGLCLWHGKSVGRWDRRKR